MCDLDLVALTFIVFLEAAKAAQEDLKAIIAAVKKLNEEKEGWRQVAKTLNAMANGTAPQHDVDDAKDMVKHKLDSLSELGEMESLRLQLAMDRLAKLMSTLSNLLKKASETASGITQNIK